MTAEELLSAMAEPLAEDGTYCTIDPETRVITIPPEYQLLGVESDEKAERIYFKCPKIVGDNIDLSTLGLRINFQNAGRMVDQYRVDDVAVDGDNITFSWLLSRRVTQYEGDVNFIVCAVKVNDDATITNEWNTTLATAQVLEGLEVEENWQEEEEARDLLTELLYEIDKKAEEVKESLAAPSDEQVNNAVEKYFEENPGSIVAVDETLTKEGFAADAKVVGEKLKQKAEIKDEEISETNTWSSSKIDKLIKEAFVTPEMFGAKGDGVTDDTEAIQEALDIGKPVYFSRQYLISRPLAGKNSIAGIGKIFYGYNLNQGRKSDIDNIFTFTGVSDVTISGITVDGNRDISKTYGESDFGEWGYGIILRGCKNVVIDNVKAINCQGDGIGIGQNSGEDSRNVTVKNCTFNNNYRNGVSVTGGFSITIKNCYSENKSGYCAIIVEPDSNSNSDTDMIYILNNTIKNIEKAGFTISVYKHDGTNVKNVVIKDNYIFKTGTTSGSAQYSLLFGGEIESLKIVDNYIFSNTLNNPQVINFGISVSKWALSVLIKGNTFDTDYVGTSPYGIYLCGHKIVNVIGNTFRNIGVYFNDNPDTIIIDGNLFEYDSGSNNLTASFLINCICKYFIFKNNTVVTPVQFLFDKVGSGESVSNSDTENITNMMIIRNTVIYNGSSSYFVTLFRSKYFNIDKLSGQWNNGDLSKATRQHRINKGNSDLGISDKITVYNDTTELPSNGTDKSLVLLVNDAEHKFGFFDLASTTWKFIPISAFTENVKV